MSNCTYFSNISGSTATLAVIGNGSYVNCGEINGFLNGLVLRQAKTDLVVDFNHCTGLDSTFLGLLARTAIDFTKKTPEGRLIFINIQGRNLATVKNLGLHHIIEVVEKPLPPQAIFGMKLETTMCDSDVILSAHNALIRAFPPNEPKFNNVVAALVPSRT